jgi:Ser-tRNA(Ala) deacylase AlaX
MESKLTPEKLYLTDSYLFECTAKLVEINDEGNSVNLILDRTIFHSQVDSPQMKGQ